MTPAFASTPAPIAALLDSRAFRVFARLVLTFIFWGAALGKIADYPGTLAEMTHFGLAPAGLFAPLVIVTLLAGSVLVILDRMAWLGYGILAVFVALTIPIAHAFWRMEGMDRIREFHVFVEHISLIGGLMIGAILSRRVERDRAAGRA